MDNKVVLGAGNGSTPAFAKHLSHEVVNGGNTSPTAVLLLSIVGRVQMISLLSAGGWCTDSSVVSAGICDNFLGIRVYRAPCRRHKRAADAVELPPQQTNACAQRMPSGPYPQS